MANPQNDEFLAGLKNSLNPVLRDESGFTLENMRFYALASGKIDEITFSVVVGTSEML